MHIPELWVIILAFGAAARLTRLVTRDMIFAPVRCAVIRRFGADSLPAELIQCAWCVGFWISAFVAAVALCPAMQHHPAFVFPAAALTLSHLVGLAATHLDR